MTHDQAHEEMFPKEETCEERFWELMRFFGLRLRHPSQVGPELRRLIDRGLIAEALVLAIHQDSKGRGPMRAREPEERSPAPRPDLPPPAETKRRKRKPWRD